MKVLFKPVCGALMLFAFLNGLSVPCSSQKLSRKTKSAEKRWAVTHPFIAARSLRLTKTALAITRTVRGHYGLDSAQSEGSFDAFRHGYWMATLAQHYKPSKVKALGDAHEKSNYISFLRKEKEHGIIPDSVNSEMDKWNNMRGIEIGAANKKASADSLRILVLNEIAKGTFRMILKDDSGRYLDCQGKPIPPEKLKGTWANPKCLTPSRLN